MRCNGSASAVPGREEAGHLGDGLGGRLEVAADALLVAADPLERVAAVLRERYRLRAGALDIEPRPREQLLGAGRAASMMRLRRNLFSDPTDTVAITGGSRPGPAAGPVDARPRAGLPGGGGLPHGHKRQW